ncbi:MAG TPA: carbamate kinase [Bacteroidales bacterium]|nr:carbamate kinase [Bacteroidales bacterium]
MKKLSVLAFGGNALLRDNQAGTIDEQEQNVYDTCKHLVGLIKSGYDLVIGHGNGPQVGTVLLQHEAGNRLYGLPKQPIDFCVAETQGSIGFMFEQQIRNVLYENGIKRNIVTLVTQVIVDRNDPAFQNPNKPVGPFYTEEEMAGLKKEHPEWVFHEDPRKRGWRRVVASPRPIDIPNWEAVEKLARTGTIVITVGGGGIPAYIDEKGKMIGIDAVVDKDLASSMLARQIGADEFCILTDVQNVFINFHKPGEQKLGRIFATEIKKHLADGQFAEGSMAPKVRACIEFVENGGKEAIITEVSQLGNPEAGTVILS